MRKESVNGRRGCRIKKTLFTFAVDLTMHLKQLDGIMTQFVRVMALMVLFALGAWNAKGQAQQGWTEYDVDGVKWLVQKVDGGEAYRIKPKDETVGDIRIPALIDNGNIRVVEIAEDAFTIYGGGLTKVTISGGIETIGSKAFKDCKKLKEVTIEGGVKTIAYKAFYGCKSIKSLVIPASVETLEGNENTFSGEGSFEGCDALTSLKIGAQTIGRYAFKGCENLKEVTIEEGVKTIAYQAFYGCKGIESLVIPASVETLAEHEYIFSDEGSFEGCSALATLKIGAQTIGRYAFKGCGTLKEVTIEKGVKTIKDEAFSGCRMITKITVPSSVTQLGANAFGSCAALSDVIWLASADCDVNSHAFESIAKPATLHVRLGEKAKIESNGKTWWHPFTIVEDGVADISTVESTLLATVRVVANPMHNTLTLEGTSSAVRVEVYSMAGTMVQTYTPHGEPRIEIAADRWSSGVYMVRMVAQDGARVMQVVKR